MRVRQDGLATFARVAAVVASGASMEERARDAVDELQKLIPMENALLSYFAPSSGTRTAIVNNGYSDRLVACLNGNTYQAELVEPFALPNNGWPVRENDLPVDPMSLRCVSEHFRPEGLYNGLMCALVTSDSRYVGFLDMSSRDHNGPSDEACAVIGHLAPTLAILVDPLQSARRLAATLDHRATAVGFLPDGQAVSLQGAPVPEALTSQATALHEALRKALAGGRPSTAFLWPETASSWYRCRAFRCHDGTFVVGVMPPDPSLELTRRELEVLTCLTEGRANAEIADKMYITVRTVKAHVEHILAKLGVPSRTAAVVRAMADGLRLPSGV
jgi:DNA-binding NarL/FixJ family response regulator